MDLNKLIYDVREGISGMSDDRRVDDRYIVHLINVYRADLIKKYLSKRPGYDTINLEQNWHTHVESVSRSIFPNLNIECKILRSKEPVPEMITTDTLSQNFRVRTADILRDTIEIITSEKANAVTFEFDVVYAFLDYKHYLYFISKKNHQELKYAVVTSVFADPEEVDDELDKYPLPDWMWSIIRPLIIEFLLARPLEDPINNSEPDYTINSGEGKERRAQTKV